MDKTYISEDSEQDDKFADTEQITRTIGVNLKRARLERGFSLDEVSSRSTVSKSMLSDIERGRKCPTVAVLYKICEGINISLPSLLKAPEKIVEVVKSKKLVRKGEFNIQHMFRYDIETSMEITKAKLDPHTELTTDSHGNGVWEYVLVIEGVFTLVLDGETYDVKKGEAVKFLANRKHTYANRTDNDVWAYDIVYYGA
ncbi:MAG: helix-turn-helix transcriptional regulator [Synergistaceae bacterium]|nr:helix-turn-helix transcriptional regulator [Synergistaceae bacterium]